MLYRTVGACLWLILGFGGAWALRESGSGAGGYALLGVAWLAGLAYVFRARVPRELPPPEVVQAKPLHSEPERRFEKEQADSAPVKHNAKSTPSAGEDDEFSLKLDSDHVISTRRVQGSSPSDEEFSLTLDAAEDESESVETVPGQPGGEKVDSGISYELAASDEDEMDDFDNDPTLDVEGDDDEMDDLDVWDAGDDNFDDALGGGAPDPKPATRGLRAEQPAVPAAAAASQPEEMWRAKGALAPQRKYKAAAAPAVRTAQLTVRYYSRMRKEQVYPLHVALSESEVRELRQKTIAQAKAVGLQVKDDSVVTVRPEIPGCDCQPGQQTLLVGSGPLTSVTFYITPWAKGALRGARLLASVDGREVAQIPLQMQVVQGHTFAVLSMVLGWGVSVGVVLLECFGLDLKTQVNQGFTGWQGVANDALQLAAAETSKLLLAGGLLLLLSAWWFGWRIIRREDPAQFVLLESKPAPQPVA